MPVGFNLLNAVAGAAQGFLMTGNPVGALAGGVGGAIAGNHAGAGGLGSFDPAVGMQQAMNQVDEYNQLALNAENMRHNDQMQWQSTAFNEVMDEKSEQMREMNVLRDVSMAQRKADNAILKEFIQTIKS
jgi:hypothetical protein